MSFTGGEIERTLRLNLDEDASVQPLNARLSAYLSSAYSLLKVKVLGETFTLAAPTDEKANLMKTPEGTAMWGNSLDADVGACSRY